MIKLSKGWAILIILFCLVSFLVFCRFTCLLYFLGDKFILVLRTFDKVFPYEIRLVCCKVLLYCIWNGFGASVVWRPSDSLVFLLIHSFSMNKEPA